MGSRARRGSGAGGQAVAGALRIVAVGRAGTAPEAALFDRYARRFQPRLALAELPDGSGDPAEIRRREAAAILAALPARALLVALDAGGEMPSSEEFARRLEGWLLAARPIVFALGGAEGLDRAILGRADWTLSLGRLTWPHLLARAMLAEQLYRARSILAGHPYHRAGRA